MRQLSGHIQRVTVRSSARQLDFELEEGWTTNIILNLAWVIKLFLLQELVIIKLLS